MIPSNILTALQGVANGSLDLSFTIKRATRTKDTTGHYSDTWNTIVTVSGNLSQPPPAQLQNYDYLIGALDAWLVRVQVGNNLLPDDRLVTAGGQTMRCMI